MLAKLEMILEGEQIDYRNSSNLQGVLMERIDTEYAEILHEQRLNPYSQYLIKNENQYIWCIQTLNEEAYEQMIQKMISQDFSEFQIKNKKSAIRITEKKLNIQKKANLMEQFYEEPGKKYYNIEFMTPTSFKRNGQYQIFPDLSLIYRSLMKKYSASTEELDMYDEDTLEQLVENSEITRYKLQSIGFPMEGITIPAYKGNITVKMKGNDTISRYARLLFSFGEYSGVGIKSAIGMGAMKCFDRKK